MYRVLTPNEWNAVAAVEAVLYRNDFGVHGFTDVRDREDSEALACMWDDAESSLELFVEDEGQRTRLVADRVARAQYFLVVGDMPERTTCKCGMWPVEEYGEECPSCHLLGC